MEQQSSKNLSSLVEDIYDLFKHGKAISDEDAKDFGLRVAGIIQRRLGEALPDAPIRGKTLRVSNIGKPDRQLYYEIRTDLGREELEGYTLIKFLYGDILEEVLLFAAEQAGHSVSDRQREVDVGGIKGHIDAVIDGVVVDCKSASVYAFQKFKNGTLQDNDAFGYYDQLAGYSCGLGGLDGAFLAIEKEKGHVALLEVPAAELKALDTPARVEHLKAVMASDELPERCFEPAPEGESGNMKLGVNCSYCPYKFECWKDANNGVGLRSFLYGKGPVHLVKVVREPKVQEVTF